MIDHKLEQARIRASIFIPLIFLFMAYAFKFIEWSFNVDFSYLGIEPLTFRGLPGIVLSALLHGDFAHLYANTIPLMLLGTALFYYYRDLALPVFLLIWITSGAWTWLFARSGVHIGASGLIYGLASFHFVSAIIRRNSRLLGFALVIVFLYGGLLWGIFPAFDIKGNISWEGHLMGMLSGVLYAVWYRKRDLPWIEDDQDDVDPWDDDVDDDDEDEDPVSEAGDPDILNEDARPVNIRYRYVSRSGSELP